MATIIQTDGDFSAVAAGVILPVRDGVLNWNELGGSLPASLRNFADQEHPLVSNGAPVVSEDFVSFNGEANYFQTGRGEANDMTWFCVARAPGATQTARLISNATTTTGATLYMTTALALAAGAYYSDAPTTIRAPQRTLANLTAWRLLVARFVGGVGHSVWNMTDEPNTPSNYANTNPRVLGSNTIRVGARVSSSAGSTNDIAFDALYNRALSNDEIAAVCVRIRALMDARDINV